MTDATLMAALAEFKPTIAARYTAQATDLFARMQAAHGPALHRVGSSHTFGRSWANWISGLIGREGRVNGVSRVDAPAFLDTDRLATAAEEYATAAVTAWADKISAKMGELKAAKVQRLNGASFRILGAMGATPVSIEQTMIVNHSAKGTLFNQFPARIYVDGKFTSEASWKRLRAGAGG